jgi:hypothetical protein
MLSVAAVQDKEAEFDVVLVTVRLVAAVGASNRPPQFSILHSHIEGSINGFLLF